MKRRVTSETDVNSIVAFSDVDGNVYILVGINDYEGCTWAFHPLYGHGFPEFISSSLMETIQEALEQYDVYTFETQLEFTAWVVNEVSNDE